VSEIKKLTRATVAALATGAGTALAQSGITASGARDLRGPTYRRPRQFRSAKVQVVNLIGGPAKPAIHSAAQGGAPCLDLGARSHRRRGRPACSRPQLRSANRDDSYALFTPESVRTANARKRQLRNSAQLQEHDIQHGPRTPVSGVALMARARLADCTPFACEFLPQNRMGLVATSALWLQLDTVLRLYAAFFAPSGDEFCRTVLDGKQVDRLRSVSGERMKDKWLAQQLAERYPWVVEVYRGCSAACRNASWTIPPSPG